MKNDKFTKYYKDVLRYCITLEKDTEKGKDLAQQVYLKIYNSKNRSNYSDIKSYLLTVAKRTFFDNYRNSKCQKNNKSNYKTELTTVNTFSSDNFEKDINNFINSFESKESDIFTMYKEGFNKTEISKIKNISYYTVLVRINKIKKALKVYIKRNYFS